MWESIEAALSNIASFEFLGALVLGVSIGFVIGIIPGLGGLVGLSVVLSFMFGMDPVVGIAILIGLSAVNDTTASFPSILIGVPGSAGSTATVLDGHPMAKLGQGAKALGAAFSASMLGGVFGGIVLMVVIFAATPLVQALGTPELLMLTILGMVAVGALVSGNVLAGVSSALLGAMLATIGGAPATPVYRYTFDQPYLFDGVSIVIVAMGIFAIPEILAMLINRTRVSQVEGMQGSVWEGFRETLKNKALVLRSSLLGTVGGAIPGMGGSVIDEIAYSVGRATSRDSHTFGTGDVRGVIAPESANNAKEGGALIPTLILGIPGSATTAVLMGGFVTMGITFGPNMLDRDLDITLTVVWTLILANILATAACLLTAKYVSRITLVPGRLLAPLLLVLFLTVGFQTSRNFGDIIAIIAIGILGYVMKIMGWPRVPFLIGFVLLPSVERYLHLSISRYEMEWLFHPGVIVIGVLILAVGVVLPIVQYVRSKKYGSRGKKAFV